MDQNQLVDVLARADSDRRRPLAQAYCRPLSPSLSIESKGGRNARSDEIVFAGYQGLTVAVQKTAAGYPGRCRNPAI